jgi:hypothetical protein
MKPYLAFLAALAVLFVAAAGYAEPESPKSHSSLNERCLDQYGQPTLYAITELTGPEFVLLLEEQGYKWQEKDEVLRNFKREILLPGETICQFVTIRSCDGYYSDIWPREKYDKATEKGGIAMGQVEYEAAGYGSHDEGVNLEEAVEAFVNIEIEDRLLSEEYRAVFLKTKDSSGRKYIVSVTEIGPARLDIQIDTDKSLATNKPPSSVDKEWKALKKVLGGK